jgi:hypothetical protein
MTLIVLEALTILCLSWMSVNVAVSNLFISRRVFEVLIPFTNYQLCEFSNSLRTELLMLEGYDVSNNPQSFYQTRLFHRSGADYNFRNH